MDDYENWLNARREYLRIVGGPVFSDLDAFSVLFCDDEYCRDIIRAADADKPIPRKLTAQERKRHRKAASDWICAMKLWAKDMRKNKLPGRKA